MQRIPSLLLASALLVSLAPLQKPPPRPHPQGDADQKPLQSKAIQLANKKTIAAMQGAWTLTDMHLVDQDVGGMSNQVVESVGFCLVSGNHLSIELHVRGVGAETGGDRGRSFVTGLHRFELDQQGDLETSTIIGVRMSDKGLPEYEKPGGARHYAIELTGESMTLTRDDGHTLVFERLRDDPSRFDFFGNPISEKDADEDAGKGDEEKK